MPSPLTSQEIEIRHTIARNVVSRRKLLNLNRASLANRMVALGGSDALANRFSVRRIEAGSAKSTGELLELLAKALDCFPSDFFTPAPAGPYVSDRVTFLDSAKVPSGLIRRGLEAQCVAQLRNRVSIEATALRLPPFEHPCSRTIGRIGPAHETRVATLIRDKWGLGKSAPIASVDQVLDDHGITVLDVDATPGNELPWIASPVLVGDRAAVLAFGASHTHESRPARREQVTSAAIHLLFHLAEWRPTAPATESLIQGIVRTLLLPTQALNNLLRCRRNQVTGEAVLGLEARFGLTRAAVVQRLMETGQIDERHARRLLITTSGTPALIPSEKSFRQSIVGVPAAHDILAQFQYRADSVTK